jgi:hypothetical protein
VLRPVPLPTHPSAPFISRAYVEQAAAEAFAVLSDKDKRAIYDQYVLCIPRFLTCPALT